MKKHFYIFRHGQTIWNAEGRPQGQSEFPVPLTITGQEQARALAQKLADKKIKLIVSSDLLRAKQTAEIVAAALKVPVKFDSRLREVDYGTLNGLYALEREEVCPDYRRSYDDITIPFPQGESLLQVSLRLKAALEEIANTCSNRAIGIASHGHAISTLIEILFNYKPKSMDNCDYVHITYNPEKHLYEGVELPPDRGY